MGLLSADSELGPFAFMTGALLLVIVAAPLDAGEFAGTLLTRGAVSLALVAGVWVASRSRVLLVLGLLLAMFALVSNWASHVYDTTSIDGGRAGLVAAFFFFTAGVVLKEVLRQAEVSLDTILGGINVYLLLAFGFTFLYGMLEIYFPGSFAHQGVPVAEYLDANPGHSYYVTFLYFSLTTVTTLGYGDIVPTSPVPRLTATVEAVVGQLYIAIFIARLVALYSGRRR